MITFPELLTFCVNHPFLAWCSLWLLWLPYLAFEISLRIVTRTLRMFTVAIRGWPPSHLDADGDWRPLK
jgi:hypothetical protein